MGVRYVPMTCDCHKDLQVTGKFRGRFANNVTFKGKQYKSLREFCRIEYPDRGYRGICERIAKGVCLDIETSQAISARNIERYKRRERVGDKSFYVFPDYVKKFFRHKPLMIVPYRVDGID